MIKNFSMNLMHQQSRDCGVRSFFRQPRLLYNKQVDDDIWYNSSRNPKIMYGIPTQEGQYPWQVSLELLHPSFGFIGHWCGGVLIDEYWIISAAHCVHNDLFNLPLPALWTVVLGEYNRTEESGFEQRIPVDKIVMHEKYHHFKHDLALFKLSKPARISISSQVAKICLPFADVSVSASYKPSSYDDLDMNYGNLNDRDNNNLRNFRQGRRRMISDRIILPKTAKHMVQELLSKSLTATSNINRRSDRRTGRKIGRRRNDKYAGNLFLSKRLHANTWNRDIQVEEVSYYECVATGWGVDEPNGDLTDVLLQTKVPIHMNDR
uniref:CSON002527 protein n=1 Tax=Culicoides sonorensis TaxID=179676 RepID=A0A336LWT8_CULSO